jgi:energy-coupling factor transport system ATP-binding protein
MIARTAPTLAMEGVNHVYPGGVRALRDVTLEIPGGQRVAIIGQNGSGKSTLVRHLNGLLRPTSGRVLLAGADVAGQTVAQLARSVGLVFQDPDRQIFSGSVRNEVEFGPRNVGMRRDELRATVLEAIAAVGLEDEEGTNPYDLGGSRRKLLALASVLAMRTPVLVLDEPTTGQDLHGVRIVRRVVADANAEGRTVIAISHDMEFVAETFDRVVVLREGEVIMDGSPRTVFGEASWGTLRSTFLEPPLAAVAGARLGLGPTPSVESLLEALAAQ